MPACAVCGYEATEADRLASAAVEVAERTDGLDWQGDALSDLGEVLAVAGRTDEAARTLEQALDRYERKRNVGGAKRTRAKLAQLRSLTRK